MTDSTITESRKQSFVVAFIGAVIIGVVATPAMLGMPLTVYNVIAATAVTGSILFVVVFFIMPLLAKVLFGKKTAN